MNAIEFNGKRILWGEYWNAPTSSMLTRASIVKTAGQIAQEQTRFTYQEWLAAGQPTGMQSHFYTNHPEHAHQHAMHEWGMDTPGVYYDPDDPRPHWTWSMGGLAPGEVQLDPEGRIIGS